MLPLRKDDITELSDIQHCLHLPGMYIGSKSEELVSTYVYEKGKLILKDVPQIYGMLKLFDELVMNSCDEAKRCNFKYGNRIKVSFNKTTGEVSVEDNGRGLPIELRKDSNKWTPEIIFSKLKSGSNFTEKEEMLAGQYGIGGSLVPIYSRVFEIETANGSKKYTQKFENHLSVKRKPVITESKENYTIITYTPNYDYFNVSEEVSNNISSLYEKRIRDLAFVYPEVTFYYQKEKISVPRLPQFVSQIHPVFESNEVESNRIAIFYSETEFQQISFVNGVNTSRGGTHIDYTMNKIIEYVREYIKKKHKLEVKPVDVRSGIFLLLSIRMINPAFSGQTKDRLDSVNNFKQQIDSLLTESFLKSITKNEEIMFPIVEAYRLKQQVKENQDLKKTVEVKKGLKIENYYPAFEQNKYIVFAEGISANGLIMSVLGRKHYGYYPLKGKILNCLECSFSDIKKNKEVINLIKIINLNLEKDEHDLNYENILVATDADKDGDHIKSLHLCLYKRFGTSLLKQGRVKFLRTPIIIGKQRGKIVKYFFTITEYSKYLEICTDKIEWRYIKGLASLKKEDLDYLIKKDGLDTFIHTFEIDDTYEEMIQSWMSEKTSDVRKEYLREREMDISKL